MHIPQRSTSSSPPVAHRSASERGSALVLAILVSVLLTLLGISFLVMSDIENRISENEKYDAQALYVAEAGARAVAQWFDRPGTALAFADDTVVDRTLRLADPDGPGPAGAASGTVYKGGVDLDGAGGDDVFDRPYRGGPEHQLLGNENGPDMRIDDAAPGAARDFLWNVLSPVLVGDFPDASRGVTARISRIDVYGPPHLESAPGVWTRYGIGTVRVVARIYKPRADGALQVVGEKQVKAVLNETPYPGPHGPMHSCAVLELSPDMTAHWGAVTALDAATVQVGSLPWGLPHSVPAAPRTDPLWGSGFLSDFDAFKGELEERVPFYLDDPWFRLVAGGSIASAASHLPHPYPATTWETWDAIDEPDPNPFLLPCCGQSNLFQFQGLGGCPVYPYEVWKMIAGSGGRDTRYFVHAGGDLFRENGRDPALSFADITDAQEGVFFFDTADRLPPTDADGDGSYDNLTPAVVIADRQWSFRGVIYLNAVSFQATNVTGRAAVFNAPGEPFEDTNQNGRHDAGEGWVDLAYSTVLNEEFASNTDRYQGAADGVSAVRASRGPDIARDASLWGILYTNGRFESTGTARHYGSVIAREGAVQTGAVAGVPRIYWDETIVTDWPPVGWDLPRVVITRWSTGRSPG